MSENREVDAARWLLLRTMDLDHAAYYRALQARDRRFDGRLFVAVKTTGIYCRPICPARIPKPENVIFFATAAAAAEDGFRPCLRCRPEVSPLLATWNGTSNTVARALRLIEAGALDEQDLETLASRLGVGERHLRRLFARHLGASPIAVMQTRRVHLAKQLLHETQLPMIDVALAAGFGSVRRFNETFKALFARPPSSLRRRRLPAEVAGRDAITLQLPYSAPYAWPQMLHALAHNALPGIEAVLPDCYVRSFGIEGSCGLVSVRQGAQAQLWITVHCSEMRLLQAIITRVRRMFDLAADPVSIDVLLRKDRWLAPLVTACPGLRIVGAWDIDELCWRAVLRHCGTDSHQEFGARYGAPLPAHLAALYPGVSHVLPTCVQMARAKHAPVLLHSLAQALCGQSDWITIASVPELMQRLQNAQVPASLAHDIAMQQLQPTDRFDTSETKLRGALDNLTGRAHTEQLFLEHAEQWRPWRAYAAAHLRAMQNVPATDVPHHSTAGLGGLLHQTRSRRLS